MNLWRRAIAWLVLAGFLSAQGAVWVAAVHADMEDDAACASLDGPAIVGPHHQAGLQFEETNLPNPIEHCALCHMERAVGGARFGRVAAVSARPRLVGIASDSAPALAVVVIRATAPRGPPALLAA